MGQQQGVVQPAHHHVDGLVVVYQRAIDCIGAQQDVGQQAEASYTPSDLLWGLPEEGQRAAGVGQRRVGLLQLGIRCAHVEMRPGLALGVADGSGLLLYVPRQPHHAVERLLVEHLLHVGQLLVDAGPVVP